MRRIKIFVESSFNKSEVYACYDSTQPNELVATFRTKAHKSLAHMFKSAFDMHQNTVFAHKNLNDVFEFNNQEQDENFGNTTSYYERRNGKINRLEKYQSFPPNQGVTFSSAKKSN